MWLGEQVTVRDSMKLDMRVGKVLMVEKIPGTAKLYKIQVGIGSRKIQIVSSLADYYKPDELLGKKIIVLVNLKPAKFHGEKSEGMLLCAEIKEENKCVLLTVDREIKREQ